METYTLVVLVALFLGVVGIIVMLEQRRRKDLAQFDQLYQTLSNCAGWLQAIHSGNEAQMSKMAEALSKLQAAVEDGAKNSSESVTALSSEAVRVVEKAVVHFESALLQHQKAQDASSQSVASKLSDVARSTSKELLTEAQHTTKAVQDLKASMEESVNFK